jgi:hypothetical protein
MSMEKFRVGKGRRAGCAFTILSGPDIDEGGVFEAHVVGDDTPHVRERAELFANAPATLEAARAMLVVLKEAQTVMVGARVSPCENTHPVWLQMAEALAAAEAAGVK